MALSAGLRRRLPNSVATDGSRWKRQRGTAHRVATAAEKPRSVYGPVPGAQGGSGPPALRHSGVVAQRLMGQTVRPNRRNRTLPSANV